MSRGVSEPVSRGRHRWISAAAAGLLAAGVLSIPASASAAPAVKASPQERASARAKQSGKPVTVVESVTESRKLVANPDGSFTAEIHGGPARFRDAQGSWVDVDLALTRRADGSIAPKAHPRGLVLAGASGAGSHDLARFTTRGHEIAVGWTGALPEPSLSGTKATYVEALPGVDVVVEVTRLGFEYFLVVKSRAAAERVAQVSLPWRAQGLTAEHTATGAVKLRDKAGSLVAWSPAAEMWDARVSPVTGDPVAKAPVQVTVKRFAPTAKAAVAAADTSAASTADVMRVVPDAKFLADPKTVYPVVIDPTVSEFTDFDTFTQSNYTSDQSGMNNLKLGSVNDGTGLVYARSHLRFDGLQSYAGVNVVSATLNLWNYHSYSCVANAWQVWRTNAVTSAVRYTTPPTRLALNGTTTQTRGGVGCPNTAGWVTNTTTEAFATTLAAGQPSVSLEIAAQSTASQQSWKRFDSMEGVHAPYVVLTYTLPNVAPNTPANLLVNGVACDAGGVRPTISLAGGQPTLQATVTDPDGATTSVTLYGRFYAAALGELRPGSPTVTSAPASGTGPLPVSAQLPAGFAQAWQTYWFQVKAWDGQQESASFSAVCEFDVVS